MSFDSFITDEQQTVRIVGDLDLQASLCRLTVPPRVCQDLWNQRGSASTVIICCLVGKVTFQAY